MPWLLGAIGLILLLAMLLRGFMTASPAQVRRGGALVLAIAGGIGCLVLLLSGRAAQALPLLLTMAPFGIRLWRGWRTAKRFGAPGDQTSQVRTATLEMRLDLATGLLSGRVRRGKHAGRELGELPLDEVLTLLRDCAADDPESIPLLESWLDRAYPDWRKAAPPASAPMDQDSALKLLELGKNATEAEIRAAHRRLMRQAHPDNGGSAEAAVRLNQARDILLKGKRVRG